MTDIVERLRARKTATAWERGIDLDYPTKWEPDALCAEAATEIERLTTEVAELDALRDKLADILKRTAIALRGPEPPLTMWSWHDLPERAAGIAAHERERCAKLCDGIKAQYNDGSTGDDAAASCASAIRAL